MSARDKILNAVSLNKPELVPMPQIIVDRFAYPTSLMDKFKAMLTWVGGTPVVVSSMKEIADDLKASFHAGDNIVNTIQGLGDVNIESLLDSDATMLEPVYKVYMEGTAGVAENGSVWLDESKIINRLLPFICQHLVIVLEAGKIVADMHEAYKQIDTGKEGYGVFVAGPSKTADIEQSLVIGAHGARSLQVFLLKHD